MAALSAAADEADCAEAAAAARLLAENALPSPDEACMAAAAAARRKCSKKSLGCAVGPTLLWLRLRAWPSSSSLVHVESGDTDGEEPLLDKSKG